MNYDAEPDAVSDPQTFVFDGFDLCRVGEEDSYLIDNCGDFSGTVDFSQEVDCETLGPEDYEDIARILESDASVFQPYTSGLVQYPDQSEVKELDEKVHLENDSYDYKSTSLGVDTGVILQQKILMLYLKSLSQILLKNLLGV